jgi:hypothetical protein
LPCILASHLEVALTHVVRCSCTSTAASSTLLILTSNFLILFITSCRVTADWGGWPNGQPPVVFKFSVLYNMATTLTAVSLTLSILCFLLLLVSCRVLSTVKSPGHPTNRKPVGMCLAKPLLQS